MSTRLYCTLFDKNYLAKGLALHASLMRHAQPFKLYILALDDETLWLLDILNLDNVVLIPLSAVESRLGLEDVRTSRNWMEYCWTLASQLMQFILLPWSNASFPDSRMTLTYLDSDLYFYSSPDPIYNELGDASIAIIPHRFHRGNARLMVNGIYNVGWLTIRNTIVGMVCLNYWAQQCRDWCYHRNEDGKFGDQAYLDEWPYTYGPSCKVINHIGAGLAPWNVMSYVVQGINKPDSLVYLYKRDPREIDEIKITDVIMHYPLIFYHFHEFTHDEFGNMTRRTRHPHTPEHRRLIYEPYEAAIKLAARQIIHAKQIRRARLEGADRA